LPVALGQVIGDGQLELVSVDDDPQVERTTGAIGHVPLHRRQFFRCVGGQAPLTQGVWALEEIVHHNADDVGMPRGQLGHQVGLVCSILCAGIADDRPEDPVDIAQGECVSVVGRRRQAGEAHHDHVAYLQVPSGFGRRHTGIAVDAEEVPSRGVRTSLVAPEPQAMPPIDCHHDSFRIRVISNQLRPSPAAGRSPELYGSP